MRGNLQGREGFTLGIVVLGLLVAGALIGVVFFGAIVEARSGRATAVAARAAAAAESGWQEVVASWPVVRPDTLGPGWQALPPLALAGGATASRRIRRLNARQFLVESVGSTSLAGGVSGRRTLAVLLDSDSGGARALGFGPGPWWFALSPW